MFSSSYVWEKNIGRFSVARSVLWVFVISVFLTLEADSNHNSPVSKYFSAVYQFYVLFCVYAYVQMLEGLKHESSKEMLYILIDAVVSAISNVVIIGWFMFIINTTLNKPLSVLIIMALNAILIIVNIFSFKTLKRKYFELKVRENEETTEKFLKTAQTHEESRIENNYEEAGQMSKSSNKKPLPQAGFVLNEIKEDADEPVDYMEVDKPQQEVEEEIYSDVQPFEKQKPLPNPKPKLPTRSVVKAVEKVNEDEVYEQLREQTVSVEVYEQLQDEAVEYVEVEQKMDSHIDEEIYSDVQAYGTVQKPEDEYNKVGFR